MSTWGSTNRNHPKYYKYNNSNNKQNNSTNKSLGNSTNKSLGNSTIKSLGEQQIDLINKNKSLGEQQIDLTNKNKSLGEQQDFFNKKKIDNQKMLNIFISNNTQLLVRNSKLYIILIIIYVNLCKK